MFEVGELVECVDDAGFTCANREMYPVRSGIYTVRDIYTDGPSGDSIWLNEIVNAPYHYLDGFAEVSFLVHRFRPFRSKHIELFRKIAENPKAPIREIA